MIVKIDRSTIKRNPRGGSTISHESGPQYTEFVIEGKLPDFIKHGENAYIKNWTEGERYEGELFDPQLEFELHKLKDIKVSIETKVNYNTIVHNPLPAYLYEYENPRVVCSACKKDINVSDVLYDYDDDGNKSTECPDCNSFNSFEDIQYEDINDAIKDVSID